MLLCIPWAASRITSTVLGEQAEAKMRRAMRWSSSNIRQSILIGQRTLSLFWSSPNRQCPHLWCRLLPMLPLEGVSLMILGHSQVGIAVVVAEVGMPVVGMAVAMAVAAAGATRVGRTTQLDRQLTHTKMHPVVLLLASRHPNLHSLHPSHSHISLEHSQQLYSLGCGH